MFAAVCALGITQITGWGTSYYCLGVLANPIAADTGWSRSLIYLGFTAALLAMGLVSTWVGRAIDRYGARGVMSLGTVLVSAALYLLCPGAQRGGLSRRLGVPRPRHAPVPVRRGDGRAGASRCPRAAGARSPT